MGAGKPPGTASGRHGDKTWSMVQGSSAPSSQDRYNLIRSVVLQPRPRTLQRLVLTAAHALCKLHSRTRHPRVSARISMSRILLGTLRSAPSSRAAGTGESRRICGERTLPSAPAGRLRERGKLLPNEWKSLNRDARECFKALVNRLPGGTKAKRSSKSLLATKGPCPKA